MENDWMFSGHFDGVHTVGFADTVADVEELLKPNGNLATDVSADGVRTFTTSWIEDDTTRHDGSGVIVRNTEENRERFLNPDREAWGL